MSHVVMHVWRVGRAAVVPAVLRMGVDRLHLASTPGLRFRKLLGTGDGRTFDVRDADVRTWALLTTWESAAASRAFEGHRTPRGWRRIAEEEYRVDLACLRTRGRWGGRAPFAVDEALARRWDGPVASLTRARIRPRTWSTFWRAVPPVVADLDRGDGPAVRLGIGEAPIGVQGTFTVWRDAAAVTEFAHRTAAHRAAIRDTATLGWYAEDLFARFAVLDERGVLSGVDRSAGRARA